MSDEFTPTIEEFVYSFVPTQWFNPTLENLWYWNIKTSMLIGGIAIRTAIMYPYVSAANVALHGSRFIAAGYAATDTLSVYSFIARGRRLFSPGFMIPATLAYLGSTSQHEAMSEAGSGVRGTGSMGVAPSMHLQGGKPWWE